MKKLKKTYLKVKQNYIHNMTQEDLQERWLSKVLDEAIEEFEKNPETISLEEWHEHMRRKFNIVL